MPRLAGLMQRDGNEKNITYKPFNVYSEGFKISQTFWQDADHTGTRDPTACNTKYCILSTGCKYETLLHSIFHWHW
jgi:hypothetical protein